MFVCRSMPRYILKLLMSSMNLLINVGKESDKKFNDELCEFVIE